MELQGCDVGDLQPGARSSMRGGWIPEGRLPSMESGHGLARCKEEEAEQRRGQGGPEEKSRAV